LTAYGKEEGLSDSSFGTVFQDREGRIWLGGDELYWFDGHRFRLLPGVANILAIAQTRDGDLWFGGYGPLYRYRAGVLTHFSIEAPAVRVIYQDRQGTLWIGALTEERPGGLYRLRDGRLEQVPGISDVRTIAEDRDGSLWLGGLEGLRQIKGSKAVLYDRKQGLSSNTVYDVHQDSTGTLWIATYGGGLNRLRDGRFKAITTKDGLPSNMLLGILDDENGNLWLSSNQGIFRLSLKELNDFADGETSSILPVTYGAAEGMRSSESNDGSPAGWRTPDGRLWFPTLRGVVAIDPNAGTHLPPAVVLEEASANKLALAHDGDTSVPPGNHTFDFRFTALSLSAPEKVRFKYRLDPFEKEWVDAGTRRTAHYTNMAPGTYSFQVVAANSYGIWNDQGARVRFVLQPHIYQTLWFRLVLLLGIVLLAANVHWLRVRRLRARAKQLKHLADTLQEQASLLNLTHDAIFVIDPDGLIKYWNRGAEERYGWTAEQAVGRVVQDLLSTVFPVPLEQIKAEVVGTGRWEGELVHTRKDGAQIVVACRLALQRNESGGPVAILETNNDITERRRTEESLRESETRFRTFVDHAADALFIYDFEQGTIVDVNRQACESIGYTRQELVGSKALAFHLDSDRAQMESVAQRVAAGESVFDTHWHRRKDGTLFSVEVHTSQYWYGGRRFLLKVARDISDRLQAEEQRAYLAAIVESSEDAIIGRSMEGIIESWNRGAERLYGYTAEEAIGQPIAMLIPRDRLHEFVSTDRLNRGERIEELDTVRVGKDGRRIPVSVIISPMKDAAGHVVGAATIARDMSARKRAEEALRRSEAYLAEGQRLSHTGSWTWNPATRQAIYFSEEMFRIFGLDPQKGIPTTEAFWQRIHPEDLDRVRDLLFTAADVNMEYEHDHRIVLPDGTVKHIHAIGHPVHGENGELVEYVGTSMDVTEQKRAEEERQRLRQVEADLAHINRVSTLGELAASIAHEVNQPLSGVVSNGSACLRWLAADVPNLDEARENVRRIVRDGKRAGEVIARIRALTKRAATAREKLDLNEIIREVLALIGDEAKRKGVIVQTQFAEDVSPVSGDRVQLQQVMLNLVMNAVEAMSGISERPRELALTSRNIDADQVLVTVEDSGTGLDPDTMDRIFNPFYTTKPNGMGMGLSISRSILQAHGGRLWATARDGAGSIFHFTLPRYYEEGSHARVTGV
jgi:PAS domain S-box-containing protein